MKKRVFILMSIILFATHIFAMSKKNGGIKGMGDGKARYLGKETCTIAGVGVFQYDFFYTKEQNLLSIFNIVCAKYNRYLTHSSIVHTSLNDAFIPEEVIDAMKRKKANIAATYMGGSITINIDAGEGRYNFYRLQGLK